MADTINVTIPNDSISVTIEGTMGVTSHAALTNLDFATAGHTGDLPMNGNKITGLASGSASGEAVTFEQVDGLFLPLAGGAMTGDILGAVNHGASGTRLTKVWTENIDSANLPTIGGATLASAMTNPVQMIDYAIPLAIDVTTYKDWKCTNVSGDTTLNITGMSDGEAGMIEIYNSASGVLTLGTMFTKDFGGVLDSSASGDNLIAWTRSGNDILYSVLNVQ